MAIPKLVALEKGNTNNSSGADVASSVNQLIDGNTASQLTTTGLIGSTQAYALSTNIQTSGFTASGDGGKGSWIQNGVTGQAPSQSPAQLGRALLNDGNGNQWKLVILTTSNPEIHPEKLGLVSDNSRDNALELRAAIGEISSIGGGVLLLPAGVSRTSLDMDIVEGLTVAGAGQLISTIKKSTGSANDKIFTKPLPENIINNFEIKNITIEGVWDEVHREEDGSLVSGRNIRKVTIHKAGFGNGRGFGLNLNLCSEVSVTGSRFKHICRDMCGVWGTSNIIIDGNIFEGNDDDCISLNTAGFEPLNGNVKSSISVTNNLLNDTGGIRIQGAKDVTIRGNILNRMKAGEGAIFLDGSNANLINKANHQNVDIAHNIILNRLDRNISLDGAAFTQNNRSCIKISSIENIDGGLLAPPRERDPVTGVVVAPYDYFYSPSGALNDQPIGKSTGIKIHSNIVRRTLPSVVNYSDWGYGQVFTRFSTDLFAPNGFTDPQITDTAISMQSVEVEGPCSDLTIENNDFSCSGTFNIWFKKLTEAVSVLDYDLRNINIRDNDLIDASTRNVNLSDYSGTKQNVVIERNLIDCDPYLKHVNRVDLGGGVLSGGWTAQTVCVGIYTSNVDNTEIRGNKFKNCSDAYIQGSSGATIPKIDNVIYAQPISIGFSTSNLGVGSIPNDMQTEAKLVYMDSDPASITYSDVLERTEYVVSGSSAPSAGFYMAGIFVKSRNITPTTKNGQTQAIHGFKRLTTGNGHIDGTDWQAVWFEV